MSRVFDTDDARALIEHYVEAVDIPPQVLDRVVRKALMDDPFLRNQLRKDPGQKMKVAVYIHVHIPTEVVQRILKEE